MSGRKRNETQIAKWVGVKNKDMFKNVTLRNLLVEDELYSQHMGREPARNDEAMARVAHGKRFLSLWL